MAPEAGASRFSVSAATAIAVAILGFLPLQARAAGTALDVQSARATGMAGAVTAMIDDSSAIYFNPAGIAQGRIVDAQIGDSLIVPGFKYTDPQGHSTRTQFDISPPLQAYESGGVTDYLSLGVGVFTPFGLTVPWPSDWAGKSIVTRSSLATYDFNPTAAVRWGPVRIGVGLQLMRGTVDLRRKIETGLSEVSAELGAATWGVGYNVGLQLEAIKQYLSLGVHYRSAVELDFTGESHFDGVPLAFQAILHDQLVKTGLTTPDILQMGVSSRPTPNLVLDADVVWYGWSKFRSIDIDFPNDATQSLSTFEPKNWNNTVNVHVGGELTLPQTAAQRSASSQAAAQPTASSHWRVRTGALYDPSPSPSSTLLPDVPDADRLNLAVGAGYAHSSGFTFDLGYQLILIFSKTSTAPCSGQPMCQPVLPGQYGGTGNVLGISIGYRTPKKEPSLNGVR